MSGLDALSAGYRDLYDRLADAAHRQPGLRELRLGGSLASGDADAYSDLDLVAVVDDHAAFDAAAVVRAATPTVLLRELPFGVTAVTPGWLRVDIVVRAADTSELPQRTGPLRGLVEEFLRVFGLLPVVAGRGEWIVGSDGVFLLRVLLIQLLRASNGDTALTGMKRLNAKLTDEQRAELEALPPIAATRDSVIACHLALALAFLPRGRTLVEDWPAELEDATRAHLQRELGLELP